MLTYRNIDLGLPVTAIHPGTGTFKPGMLVKLVAGAAAGSMPKISGFATAAEVVDPGIPKGIVDYEPTDKDVVNFAYDVISQKLGTPNDIVIPATNEIGEPTNVVVWQGTVVFGLYKTLLDASVTFSTLREPTQVAFKHQGAGLPALLAVRGLDSATDGTQKTVGYVHRVDGPEATVVFKGL